MRPLTSLCLSVSVNLEALPAVEGERVEVQLDVLKEDAGAIGLKRSLPPSCQVLLLVRDAV